MKVHLKTIICATDLSDFSNQSIPYAVALAREFKARLYVCHVIDLPAVSMYGEGMVNPQEIQNTLEEYVDHKITELVGEPPLDWEPLVALGNPASEVTRLARRCDADLALTATHGRSGLPRLVLGSVTERLMHSLPCPLLVVPGRSEDLAPPSTEKISFKRILIGCDFSPDSDLAWEYGLSLAQEFEAELHLAHVLEDKLYRNLLEKDFMSGKISDDVRDQAMGRLQELIPEEAGLWCSPVTTLLAGQPYEELTKYAVLKRMDLIVLGVRGHSLTEALLVGSTTDRVIRMAACPVLSVSPSAKRH